MNAQPSFVRETTGQHEEHNEEQHHVDEGHDIDLGLLVSARLQIHVMGCAQTPMGSRTATPSFAPVRPTSSRCTTTGRRCRFYGISHTHRLLLHAHNDTFHAAA